MIFLPSRHDLDYAALAERPHGLLEDSYAWSLVLPGRWGGVLWEDLLEAPRGTLTGMAFPGTSTSGWGTTQRLGAWGELRGDGTDDAITYASTASLNLTGRSFSVGIWMRTTATGIVTPLAIRDTSGTTAAHLGLLVVNYPTTGLASFLTWDFALNNVASTVTVNDGLWHDLVGTYNALTGLASLYVDGVLAGAVTQTGASSNVAKQLRLGANINTGGTSFQFVPGALDDPRVATRCWTAAAVLARYQEAQQGYPTLLRRLPPVWAFTPTLFRAGSSANQAPHGSGVVTV